MPARKRFSIIISAIDKATGRVVRSRVLHGEWGIPYVAFDGTVDGLSRDGRTLVIADWVQTGNSPFRPSSSFRSRRRSPIRRT